MKRLVILTAVIAAASAGGIAYATIPDSNGVLTACKLNGVGTIRLIDPSLPSSSLLGHCTSLETRISWNQKGQKGDPGGPGKDGAAGAPGANGTNGKDGAPGQSVTSQALASGDTNCPTGGSLFNAIGGPTFACNGAPGANGKDGSNGSNGTNGVNGKDGLNGNDGAAGAPGQKGDPCLPSDPACVGPKGDTGAQGPQGAAGPQGPKGDPGATFKSVVVVNGDPPVQVFDDQAIGKVEVRCTPGPTTAFPGVLYTNSTSSAKSVDFGQTALRGLVSPGSSRFLSENGRSVIGFDATATPGADEAVAIVEVFSRVIGGGPGNAFPACGFIVDVTLHT